MDNDILTWEEELEFLRHEAETGYPLDQHRYAMTILVHSCDLPEAERCMIQCEAYEWFEKAANNGLTSAMEMCAILMLDKGETYDIYIQALYWYMKILEQDPYSSSAFLKSGRIFSKMGEMTKAYTCFERAAICSLKEDSPSVDGIRAMQYCSNMYATGVGVDKDLRKARILAEKKEEMKRRYFDNYLQTLGVD